MAPRDGDRPGARFWNHRGSALLAVGSLSADRSEWFDGTGWRDASLSAPPEPCALRMAITVGRGTWRPFGLACAAQGTGMVSRSSTPRDRPSG